MAVTVTAVPDSLSFPGVRPGSSGPDIPQFPFSELPSFAGGVLIKNPTVGATVSFNLDDETGHFAIRDIFVMELVEQVFDGSESPPLGGLHSGTGSGKIPNIKVLQVVGEFDGLRPVQVNEGEALLVRVKYSALTVEGSFSSTLIIQGDTWETVSIPVILFPALVTSNVSNTLNIAQGSQATLAIVATCIMGPAVDVTYQMSHTQIGGAGLTLLPNSLHLENKQTKREILVFQADRNAPVGTTQVALDQNNFGPHGFFITANIVHPSITVNAAIPNQIRVLRKPVTIQIPITIHLNGGTAAQVVFSGTSLPFGVSFQGGSFPIDRDNLVDLSVVISKDAENAFDLPIFWSAFNGEQSGTVTFNIKIEAETAIWSLGGQTTETTLGGAAELWASSEGFFSFKGRVHDSGFFDLFYASLIILDIKNPTMESRVFQKDGSVTGTGNPFGSRDDSWTINGRDPFISDNWELIKNSTATFRLHASGKFFDVVQVVLAPVLGLIGIVKFFVEQAGDINIGGGSISHSPVQCETIITNDGPALHCSVNE